MKNIHLLPTDKPGSKLIKHKVFNEVKISSLKNLMYWDNANIYITSNEEISGFENNIWVILGTRVFHWQNTMALVFGNKPKKIILTTDNELIEDGVQAIDDTFLEWFVKNPSCEEVGIKVEFIQTPDYLKDGFYYKIIIPQEEQKELRRKLLTLIESLEQEESKPHSFCETPNEKCTMSYCDENGCQNRKRILVEPKEETLEEEYYNDFKMIKGENIIEAAKRFWKESKANPIEMAIFGAEWQEEENKKYIHKLLDIIQWYDNNSDVRPDLEKFEWYEKFKNK